VLAVKRREFLRAASATLGLAFLGTACNSLSAPKAASFGTPTSTSSGLPLPTYVPLTAGPKPDLLPSDAGLEAGYLTYPQSLFKSIVSPPGLGSDINALTWTSSPPPTPLDQNPCWQEVNKELNANLKVELVAYNDYPTRIATMVASGDVPDMFYWLSSQLLVNDMPKFLQTAYTDLTPYLAGDAIKDYPNLAAFPSSSWRQCVFNGALYAVPVTRPYFQYIWFINQSRFDDVGAQQPTTADDFKRILLDLTRPQSNQYGMGATPPAFGLLFSGRGDVPQLSMFRVPHNWAVDANGKFTKDVETEQFRAAVGYVRDLYAAGVFWPGATTNLNQTLLAGQCAVSASGWASYPSLLWDAGAKLDPPVKIRTLHPFSNDGGKPIWHQFQFNNGITPIKKSSPDRVKELLRVMNYLAAPFGSQEALLLEYGIKGVDFNFDASGNPVLTTRGQNDVNVRWNYLAQRPQVLFDPNDAEFTKTAYTDLQTIVPNLVQDPSVGLYSTTDQNKNGQLTQNLADGLQGIVTGHSPLSALDQLLSDWRGAGGNQMRMEYEQAYAQSRT
jgi:putative aldouronate transport system substrate-binding protein